MTESATASARGEEGWTDLDRAAGRGDVAVVRSLLDAGAEARATGPDGRTAYQIAVAAGHRDVAELLRAAEDAALADDPPDRGWRPYCRAYRLCELEGFPGWPEPADNQPRPEPDSVVYLQDDLTVTEGAWPGEAVLFGGGSAEWESYCRETLGFAVPDDFDLLVPADEIRPTDPGDDPR
ncbi:ankyrin repeat domain-containing protein [Kribbella sp. NBC_01505]|uniref:ankyrin repeat domain-containing protein n=1 Tax=Kribbella sp. NBC_01505 TaxID=2903580 RepID=UPI00386AAD06